MLHRLACYSQSGKNPAKQLRFSAVLFNYYLQLVFQDRQLCVFSSMNFTRSLCPGLLALELLPERAPASLTLSAESAAELSDVMASNLLRLLPGVDKMGLAIAAALYDQAQILRPDWPIFEELARLYQHSPSADSSASIACFGAAAGRMPAAQLEPERSLIGSPLMLLPWVLMGEPERVAHFNLQMEEVFTENGLADARTALFLNEAFSIKVEHARLLTLYDLCVITAMQYQHAGLTPLWSLIECALLSPECEQTVASAGGDTYRWRAGIVTIVRKVAPENAQEQRQYQAVLAAHGIGLQRVAPKN